MTLEDWPSGTNMNCFMFVRELVSVADTRSISPEGDNMSEANVIGGLAEWLKAAVY